MKVSIIPREKAPGPHRRGPAKGADRLALEAALATLTPGHVIAIKVGSAREVMRLRTILQSVSRTQGTPMVTWSSGGSLYIAQKDAL